MIWIPVSSSRMNAVAWQDNTLFVRFKDGVIYRYENVSRIEFNEFINSPSLGSALSRLDKRHPYSRAN